MYTAWITLNYILNVRQPVFLWLDFVIVCRIVYCDETGEETPSVNVHQPTTFAHKNMQMEGITVFWDEFSVMSRDGRSSPTPSVGVYNISDTRELPINNVLTHKSFILKETEPKLSPSWNPKIICEPHPQFTEPLSSTAPFETVQVGSLSGKIELSLTLKNNLALPGAKVKELNSVLKRVEMYFFVTSVKLILLFFWYCFLAGCRWTHWFVTYSAVPTTSPPTLRFIWSFFRWRWE